jgi:hypothetical protein
MSDEVYSLVLQIDVGREDTDTTPEIFTVKKPPQKCGGTL